MIIKDIEFEVEFNNSETAKRVMEKLPLKTNVTNRWGDEIYFYTDFKIPLSKESKEVMQIGDIVYWRSQKSDKEAIAIFFGNTPKRDGKKPLAASPCDVIGKINSNIQSHKKIQPEDEIQILKDT